jgi:biotin synthase-like enzyme
LSSSPSPDSYKTNLSRRDETFIHEHFNRWTYRKLGNPSGQYIWSSIKTKWIVTKNTTTMSKQVCAATQHRKMHKLVQLFFVHCCLKFQWLPEIPCSYCRQSTWQWATTASSHIHSNSLFNHAPNIRR